MFNNFKNASIEQERLERVKKNRPGSPCTKKYLCNNTEFTAEPICTASRVYQNLKIKQLNKQLLTTEELAKQVDRITEKICLCEGLCSSAYQKLNLLKPKERAAVAVCPGPNLAYFSEVYALDQMVGHIYGRTDLMAGVDRPNFLIKELELYVDYFNEQFKAAFEDFTSKKRLQLHSFKAQLLAGIDYYKTLVAQFSNRSFFSTSGFYHPLLKAEAQLKAMVL